MNRLREWARRRLHAASVPPANDARVAAADTGLPPPWARSVRSFYEMLDQPSARQRCVGTACRFEGAAPGAGEASDTDGPRPLRCLGRCYEAPADGGRSPSPIPRRSLLPEPVLLRHLLGVTASSSPWDDYELPDGDSILSIVEASGLRGRGGAAYPTGAKWRAARETAAAARIVVANGDEGDPGAYIDRLLLEEAPHSVLAGLLACARAIDATRGIVYVRGEYPRAAECVEAAIAEATARGLLSGFGIEVRRGAGAYVAGEETALLAAIEGGRAEPRPKPPYPAERGLGGLPTVVQNVETLSLLPWIARTQRRGDTKAFCLSGAIREAGVVEAPLGIPLRELLERGGGGAPRGRRWKLALVGGPLGRIVAARDFDVELSFDKLPGLGHAGIVVLDDRVPVRAVAEHLFDFASGESCGNCAPCRLGSAQLASRRTQESLEELLATLEEGSLCGFGQGVPRPIRDLVAAFGDEVLG